MTNEVTAGVGRGRTKGHWGRSCYYRKPDGWIIVGQYMGAALQHFSDRGFQRLAQYGDVTRFLDKDQEEPDPAGNWGPILRHPNGAAEFPASQVITYRWYKPNICPVSGVKFPQLKGIKIQEYQCPQCNRLSFITAEDAAGNPVTKGNGVAELGKHLQVAHSWDRMVLLAYGEKVGIDFNVLGDNIHTVVDYDFAEEEEVPEEEAVFTVEEVTAAPKRPPCDCGFMPPTGKNYALSLGAHQRLHCPLREKEAVPA